MNPRNTPSRATRITDYFKRPGGEINRPARITDFFKRPSAESSPDVATKRSRIDWTVDDDISTTNIHSVEYQMNMSEETSNSPMMSDPTKVSCNTNHPSRRNVILIDLERDEDQIDSSIPLELSSDEESDDGLEFLRVTPKATPTKITTMSTSNQSPPNRMNLSDSDSSETTSYDFSLSRLLDDKQSRSKIRKEDLADDLMSSQQDGTSILSEEEDTELKTTMRDPRVAKLDDKAYRIETEYAIELLSLDFDLALTDKDQLEKVIMENLLEQLTMAGHVLPEKLLPWLLYTMCCHSNAHLAFNAWTLFRQISVHYESINWMPNDIIQNILSINDSLPPGIIYLLRAFPTLLRHQASTVIRYHFSLLLRIALDARVVHLQPIIHSCMIELFNILYENGNDKEVQVLLDELVTLHEWSPMLLNFLTGYFLSKQLAQAADDTTLFATTVQIMPVTDIVTAIDQRLINVSSSAVSSLDNDDFSHVGLKLKLIDYVLDHKAIRDTDQVSCHLIYPPCLIVYTMLPLDDNDSSCTAIKPFTRQYR
ncbi:hypothetical protein BDF19DRAFT_437523 [Syncephalis fuscata]|nr:hypothetical protein BDF19DRAFT_437523 [Syncephalis fuscata]